MANYKYQIGLIAGRFQPFHNGHWHMLETALKQCETVVVLIGSCNNINNEYNPLNYEERKIFIRSVLRNHDIWNNERVIFAPIVDIYVGNHPTFGHYIMNMCKYLTGEYPDVLISGSEPDRDKWIDKSVYPNLEYLSVPRSDIQVSATQIRESMRAGNKEWHKMVPDCLIYAYEHCLVERVCQ